MHPGNSDHQVVGSLESGKSVIWIEPAASPGATSTLTPGLGVRAPHPTPTAAPSHLGLPGDETSDLTLELPEGWAATWGPGGQRRDPAAVLANRLPDLVVSRPGQGVSNLQLKRAGQRRGRHVTGRPFWVSGPTRIVLGCDQARPPGRELENRLVGSVRPAGHGTVHRESWHPDLELIDGLRSRGSWSAGRTAMDRPPGCRSPSAGDSRLPTTAAFRGARPGADRRSMERARHSPRRCELDRGEHDDRPRCAARDPGLPGAGRPARVPSPGDGAGGSDALVFEASSPDCGRRARVPAAAGRRVVPGTRPDSWWARPLPRWNAS